MLMQENRSFDHYFGTLSGVRGFANPHAPALNNGRSVFYQPDAVNPRPSCSPSTSTPTPPAPRRSPPPATPGRCSTTRGTAVRSTAGCLAHRKADGVNGPYVMGYYTRDDIPFQFALAETFTVCDHYFCSVFGPTWPNRLYWMTGTIDPGGTRAARSSSTRRRRRTGGRRTRSGCRRPGSAGSGVPAGRRLRLQRAGAVRELPRGRAGVRAVRAWGAPAAGGHVRGRRAERPAAGGLLDHADELSVRAPG